MAAAAPQRLARKMLTRTWPDVAGYTYAEIAGGWAQDPDFKVSVFRISQ
jgi:hypothetical protein